MTGTDPAILARRMRRTAGACVLFVAFMVGMAYAAVPLYDLFCRVTGFGGTTQVAEQASDVILDQTIVVRFDSNVAGDLPWRFVPEERRVRLRIGETAVMNYIAENTGEQETVGTSTFNVSPPTTGIFFNKLECFCFTEQALAPGERVEMPVMFFVDPAIVEDLDGSGVREITLSYTFYPVGGGARQAPVAKAEPEAAPAAVN